MNGSKTTRFKLDFQLRSLPVENGESVALSRPFLNPLFAGASVPRLNCFIDTGAAVSVVSNAVKRVCRWQAISADQPELRLWNGLRCEFGETSIRLFDNESRKLSTPLRVVGKFVQSVSPFHNDRFIIFGLNFLMDNAALLQIAGQPWNLAGHIELQE